LLPPEKPVPETVRVNAGSPAAFELGLIPVRVGTGLEGGLIVNVIPFEEPPPGAGLKTVTVAVPADTISLAGIAADRYVAAT